jgi:hypothetical protein
MKRSTPHPPRLHSQPGDRRRPAKRAAAPSTGARGVPAMNPAARRACTWTATHYQKNGSGLRRSRCSGSKPEPPPLAPLGAHPRLRSPCCSDVTTDPPLCCLLRDDFRISLSLPSISPSADLVSPQYIELLGQRRRRSFTTAKSTTHKYLAMSTILPLTTRLTPQREQKKRRIAAAGPDPRKMPGPTPPKLSIALGHLAAVVVCLEGLSDV